MSCLKEALRRLINLGCFIAFIVQFSCLIFEQIEPTGTEVFREQKELQEIEFPIIFRLCFKNAFDLDEIKEAGYNGVYYYFMGQSVYNKNLFGWAGHTKDGLEGPGIECKFYSP